MDAFRFLYDTDTTLKITPSSLGLRLEATQEIQGCTIEAVREVVEHDIYNFKGDPMSMLMLNIADVLTKLAHGRQEEGGDLDKSP